MYEVENKQTKKNPIIQITTTNKKFSQIFFNANTNLEKWFRTITLLYILHNLFQCLLSLICH